MVVGASSRGECWCMLTKGSKVCTHFPCTHGCNYHNQALIYVNCSWESSQGKRAIFLDGDVEELNAISRVLDCHPRPRSCPPQSGYPRGKSNACIIGKTPERGGKALFSCLKMHVPALALPPTTLWPLAPMQGSLTTLQLQFTGAAVSCRFGGTGV